MVTINYALIEQVMSSKWVGPIGGAKWSCVLGELRVKCVLLLAIFVLSVSWSVYLATCARAVHLLALFAFRPLDINTLLVR